MATTSNLIAAGSTIRGGLGILRSTMKAAGFTQIGGIYGSKFTDGRSSFVADIGSKCGALGHNVQFHTLRQVWGA